MQQIIKKFEDLAYKYADLLGDLIPNCKPTWIVGSSLTTSHLFDNYYGGLIIIIEFKPKGNSNCDSYDYEILFKSQTSNVFIQFNNTDDEVSIRKKFNEKKKEYESLYLKCEEYFVILNQRIEEHFHLEKMQERLKELEEKSNILRYQIELISKKKASKKKFEEEVLIEPKLKSLPSTIEFQDGEIIKVHPDNKREFEEYMKTYNLFPYVVNPSGFLKLPSLPFKKLEAIKKELKKFETSFYPKYIKP